MLTIHPGNESIKLGLGHGKPTATKVATMDAFLDLIRLLTTFPYPMYDYDSIMDIIVSYGTILYNIITYIRNTYVYY